MITRGRWKSPLRMGLTLSGNSCVDHGAGVACRNCSATFAGCTFTWNGGEYCDGGGLWCMGSSVIVTSCTFSSNGENWVEGSGIYVRDCALEIQNTIIAFGLGGKAIHCFGDSVPRLSCCDVYWNEGGDWVGCIEDQHGISGNISANPLFCNPDSGDFSISEYSPCAPGYSGCGLIGADSVGCSITNVHDADVQFPEVLCLSPAVPNPFNPITEIQYGIPPSDRMSLVTMNVYDTLGRRVRTLVDGDHGPGTYRAVWDAKDHRGIPVASGVYFYRISWNGKSETKRMVLLK